MDLSVYLSPTPRLELQEDYQAGLQSLSSIKNFFNSVLDNLEFSVGLLTNITTSLSALFVECFP